MYNKRWEKFATMFEDIRDKFRAFLKENCIYYDCETCIGGGFFFEVKATDAQFDCIIPYWNALPRLTLEIEDLDCPEFDCEVA